MPYYNEEALLPLPLSLEAGFRIGLSRLQQEETDDIHPTVVEEEPLRDA